jgi:endonuclease-3
MPKIKATAQQPKHWQSVLDKIRKFRSENTAPVDTVGCERLASSNNPRIFRYEILTALQLSSQTKDPITANAIENLKSSTNGLTIDSVLGMTDKELDGYIQKVGFHNRKTIYMKQTAQILQDEYNGDIPDTLEGLLNLPGIGPKMAHLAMQCAWDKTVGIGVDTHVHRICNRLGWVKSKDPEGTRRALEDWLPMEHWREINALLVGFGQIHCTPVKPKCASCPLADECLKVGTRK